MPRRWVLLGVIRRGLLAKVLAPRLLGLAQVHSKRTSRAPVAQQPVEAVFAVMPTVPLFTSLELKVSLKLAVRLESSTPTIP